jgi:hypothetical protein
MEVHLRVGWNGVVHYDIEVLKRDTSSGHICENEAPDLLLLDLLNSLAEFNLRNVAHQLNGGNTTLFQNHISEIRV